VHRCQLTASNVGAIEAHRCQLTVGKSRESQSHVLVQYLIQPPNNTTPEPLVLLHVALAGFRAGDRIHGAVLLYVATEPMVQIQAPHLSLWCCCTLP
jgi:hypothetical protein